MEVIDKFYNQTEDLCCDYSNSTISTMLTFMIFISCLPTIFCLFTYCLDGCESKFKIYKLRVRNINSHENLLLDECPICLEKYKKKDKVVDLNCGHIFHKSCIKLWIKKNNSCPHCRRNII